MLLSMGSRRVEHDLTTKQQQISKKVLPGHKLEMGWNTIPILKEFSLEFSVKGQILKLRLQYFGHLMRNLPGKDPDAAKE